jgi:hypothetical protein
MSEQPLTLRLQGGEQLRRGQLLERLQTTYTDDVWEPRQITDDLWLVFHGLFNTESSGMRTGIAEFFLSRVEDPNAPEYVVANVVALRCDKGDHSQLGGGPVYNYFAAGVSYPQQCWVSAGDRFVFTCAAENPDIGPQQFSF